MNINDAIEQAYKNGYNKGVEDAVKNGYAVKIFDKETPKTPIYDDYTGYYFCPNCGKMSAVEIENFDDYCPLCGQHIKRRE